MADAAVGVIKQLVVKTVKTLAYPVIDQSYQNHRSHQYHQHWRQSDVGDLFTRIRSLHIMLHHSYSLPLIHRQADKHQDVRNIFVGGLDVDWGGRRAFTKERKER